MGGAVRRIEAVAGERQTATDGPCSLAPVVHAYGLQVRWAEQEVLVDELLATSHHQGRTASQQVEQTMLRSHAALARGKEEEAEDWLESAVVRGRDNRDRRYRLRSALILARHWLDRGRVARAEEFLAGVMADWPKGEEDVDIIEARRLQQQCH